MDSKNSELNLNHKEGYIEGAVAMLKALVDAGTNILYISCPLTTNGKSFEENVECAKNFEQKLKQVLCHEFSILNPARISVEGWGHSDYMDLWLRIFSEGIVDEAALASGWEHSTGCNMERNKFCECGIECYFEDEMSEGNQDV